jgi:hypothetical protein
MFVVMMQDAEVRDLDDRAAGGRLHGPGGGSVLVEREVRSPVIVREVLAQVAAQGALVPHDDVVEVLRRM